MRTSFHHQPEAQHPKSPAIETPAGRLPHLLSESGQIVAVRRMSAMCQKRTLKSSALTKRKPRDIARGFAISELALLYCGPNRCLGQHELYYSCDAVSR
jgi:hypothetical protein